MENQLQAAWEQAKQNYIATLSPKEVRAIENVGSMDDLTEKISTLQQGYQNTSSGGVPLPNLLTRAEPLILQLQSFSAIIGTFIQSNPDIAALIWGSLAFVLEVG